MRIERLFKKDIGRSINGVVKADELDDGSVWQELEEFVVTKELDGHLRTFFTRYCEALDAGYESVSFSQCPASKISPQSPANYSRSSRPVFIPTQQTRFLRRWGSRKKIISLRDSSAYRGNSQGDELPRNEASKSKRNYL